jgi:hypothetical protein
MKEDQDPEERKKFLAELREIATYTAIILQGEEVSKVRIKQYRKYFNRTFNMLKRISVMQGEINNNSFKYGYGGKLLVRKVMLQLDIIEKKEDFGKMATYALLVEKHEITLELVSRIIVEVHLMKHNIDPI